MDKEIMGKVKKYFDKSVEVSKDALNKAGVAVQEFGEQGVLRLDINSLQARKKKQIAKLGALVFDDFTEKNMSEIQRDDADISGILKELDIIMVEISKREENLKKTSKQNAVQNEAENKSEEKDASEEETTPEQESEKKS